MTSERAAEAREGEGRRKRGTGCRKSPTGVHDFYVLDAVGPPRRDYCRWCDRIRYVR